MLLPNRVPASGDLFSNDLATSSARHRAQQHRLALIAAVVLGVTAVASLVPVQADLPATPRKFPRYSYRSDHDPNGIGKFYMGREIAHVMGVAAATWLERPEREAEENVTKLIDSLDLKPGMVVADIGAGSGVLTLRLAQKVTDTGKVIAVDLQQEMLDLLAKKLKLQKVENVDLVLGTDKSPKLPKESVDLAILVDVYHEFAFPYEMMLEIAKSMKPEGRVVLVEFRMEDEKVPIKLVHKMTEAQAKKELAQREFQLEWKETIGVLPWQHILVFERVDEKRALERKPDP